MTVWHGSQGRSIANAFTHPGSKRFLPIFSNKPASSPRDNSSWACRGHASSPEGEGRLSTPAGRKPWPRRPTQGGYSREASATLAPWGSGTTRQVRSMQRSHTLRTRGRALRGAPGSEDHRTDRRHHQHRRRPASAGPTCGPIAASIPIDAAHADGTRVLRHRRGGRQRSQNVKPGQFVVGSFFASDNTCPICQAGYQSSCVHAESMTAWARRRELRASPWPTALWLPRPDTPSDDLIPSLLATSDVLGTGWFAADAAERAAGHDGRGRR